MSERNEHVAEPFRSLLNAFSGQKVDFSCRVCGAQCDCAPNPPKRAVCPEHCDDHNYVYSRGERKHYCDNCGQEPPDDWFAE